MTSTGVPEIRDDCIDQWLNDPRFCISKFDYRDSQGGCWARHVVQQYCYGEEYTLQVDAHSRFRQGWDTLAIDMLHELPSDKPLTTSSPPLYYREADRKNKRPFADEIGVSVWQFGRSSTRHPVGGMNPRAKERGRSGKVS